jgi:peroxiredoxin
MTRPTEVASDRLPTPEADGACDHLPGARLPDLELPSSDGGSVRLADLPARTVVFVHPAIGGPEGDLLEEWTAFPGARGCTPQACGFRDAVAEFRAVGAGIVGLSNQPVSLQKKHQEELHLPYPLLSDADLALGKNPGLPVFGFHGKRYFKRVTLIVAGPLIEAALYPVFPPGEAATQALSWLRTHAGPARDR